METIPRFRATAAVLSAFCIVAGAPGTSAAGFYDPPSPLPDMAPGDIIRSQSTVAFAAPLLPMAGRAWQIMYLSSTVDGEPIAVTGTVLVPFVPYSGGARPLVSYALGGQGQADICAGSRRLATGTWFEGPFINGLLLRGWAVVVTDYPGLGTPGDHTFTVRVPQGNSVIDAARAAQRLEAAGLSEDGPVAFMGYSEGGNATAAAAELQPAYAPELNLVGVASGGVPADLVAVGQAIDGGILAGLEMSAIVGMVATYPDLPFDELLNPLGEAAFDLIKNSCTEILITTQLFQSLENYVGMTFEAMFAAFPAWQVAVDDQRLGRVAPEVPVFLYHGDLDPWIPLAVGETLRSDWCAEGAIVEWRTYPLAEHILGIPSGYPDVVAFLDGRFAGLPPVDDCAAPLPSMTGQARAYLDWR